MIIPGLPPGVHTRWRGREYLIIGQAPARNAPDYRRPWNSLSGQILAGKMGMSLSDLLYYFDTTNLNSQLVGQEGRYDGFDKREARWNATRILSALKILAPYKIVLCVGVKVCKAMGVKPLQMTQWGDSQLVGIPHTSGRNAWWNDPNNRAAGDFLLKVIGDIVLEREMHEV